MNLVPSPPLTRAQESRVAIENQEFMAWLVIHNALNETVWFM